MPNQNPVFLKEDIERFMGIKLPTTLEVAKRVFRKRAVSEHPDTSKHPEASSRFIRLKEMFKYLEEGNFLEDNEAELLTQDGIPIATLGKGLGPNINGKDCESCDGKGFTSYKKIDHPETCDNCKVDFIGFRMVCSYKCKKCQGTGKFKENRSCFTCSGTGWFFPKNSRSTYINMCEKCRGSRVMYITEAKKTYEKCFTCKGTGEIRIFNPVIPKGLLT